MTRQLILVILAFNAAVIAIGIIAYLLIHQSHRAIDAEALQRRVSEGLASVTTPAEMQSSSAAIAKMVADTHRLVHSSVAFLGQGGAPVAEMVTVCRPASSCRYCTGQARQRLPPWLVRWKKRC